MNYVRWSAAALFVAFLSVPGLADAADTIDMSEVKALAARPVKEILGDAPVSELERPNYWKTVRGSSRPAVVMFYSDVDPESQRLATLVRYVAAKYKDRLSFYRVMVVERGKPAKAIAADYQKSYSLDETPGILFYDNDHGPMVLEEEQYIDPDFKEFRTPSLFFWKTYYNAVCDYIDKHILD